MKLQAAFVIFVAFTACGAPPPDPKDEGSGSGERPPSLDAGTADSGTADNEPTGPCAGTPQEDGLACTRFACIDGEWHNTTLCAVGEACTDKGCVRVGPGPEASDGGMTPDTGTADSTPTDTKPAIDTKPATYCGDGVCNGSETATSCARDCEPPPMKPTMSCSVKDGWLVITLSGPIRGAGLVKYGSSVTDLSIYQYGSDYDVAGSGSWSLPYASGKPMFPWLGDFVAQSIALPAAVNSFTMYMANPAKTDGSWFKNSNWAIGGDCHFCDPVAKDKICH